MTTELAPIDSEAAASALEHVLATGDLAQFTPKQRVAYYLQLCQVLGLSSISRPFDWLTLDGRLILYPNKSCAEQLRRQHQISLKVTRREPVGDLFVVECEGTTPSGRTDFASKYVSLRDGRGNRLGGRDLANAYAKAETGAKRRLTFSMVGLAALPDLEEVKDVRYVMVDADGNVIAAPTEEQRHLAERPSVAQVLGEPTFETTATAEDSPVQGGQSQAPTAEELTQPKRTGPRPTLGASPEQVERWQRTWFAMVDQTSLGSDDARHRYVEQWTASESWPKAKRTTSLLTFLRRATEREAEDFLAHTRALVEDERRANEEALAEARGEAPIQGGDESEEAF